jgi:hypothetical protein
LAAVSAAPVRSSAMMATGSSDILPDFSAPACRPALQAPLGPSGSQSNSSPFMRTGAESQENQTLMNPPEASRITLTKSERLQEGLDVPRAGGIIRAARGKLPGGPSCAAAGVGQRRCLSTGR